MDFIERVKKDLAFGSRDGCYGQACRDCEYYVNESCSYHKTEVMRDALVVIESQQKEIKRLEGIAKNGNGFIEKCDSRVAQMFSH